MVYRLFNICMHFAPASFARKTRKKIRPPVLQADCRLAFCGGKEGSSKDFMVHVLTFVRQGVRIHCSWWQKNDQNRDTHSFHYEVRKRAECTRRKKKRSMIFKANEKIRTFYSRRQLYINRAISISWMRLLSHSDDHYLFIYIFNFTLDR